jgi:stearoyl-CoA desaturase (delta-9 desaturase)
MLNNQMDLSEGSEPQPVSWLNTSFLALVHFIGIGGTIAYCVLRGASWAAVGIMAAWIGLTIFALSAGYHRLFSHKAYEAHPVLRAFLLAFGAAAFQNSALTWSADHRRHHKRTDTAADPYDARRGFWYAHIGWVLRQTPPAMQLHPVPDLEKDPLILWQHRLYPVIGIVFGFVAPGLLGLALGDGWGGFVLGGMARLVFVYHVTFSINSFAHMLGTQPYSDRNSARDSFIAAMLSMGEGYHNFHHTFPADYRNGVHAHQFDPSKWLIRSLSWCGLARNLKRTSDAVIVRARLRMQARRLEAQTGCPTKRDRLQQLRVRFEEHLAQWQAALARHETARAEKHRERLARLRPELRRLQAHVRSAQRDWDDFVRSLELGTTAAG